MPQAEHATASSTEERRTHSREEVLAILSRMRGAIKAANPANHDLLEEFLAERRMEAAR